MTKNPFLNALTALVYIGLVAFIMNSGQHFAPNSKTIFIPIAVLSLFSLSAALMAYIFGFEPGQMFLSGKKKEGITLFLQTVGIFAIFTIILFFLLFSGLIK